MKSYHIHIRGLVQGVGFRPYLYRLAENRGLTGRISNTTDGVHIEFTADKKTAGEFYRAILQSPPAHAVITSHSIHSIPFQVFSSLEIIATSNHNKPDLLLTPDFAICEECRQELADKKNRRYAYPFTTCLQCGPRYSIIQQLPYERYHTVMKELPMCDTCRQEYSDVHNRRHYSQTNSCPRCAIPMHLYNSGGQLLTNDTSCILKTVQDALCSGAIVAVKGIGGYLLLCDATNQDAIQTLRKRKYRPAKPFALLYHSIERAEMDVQLSTREKKELNDQSGPIVLCRIKKGAHLICTDAIAPGLDKIGLMLPCSPLLQLIADDFQKPLVATSANISGSPIIYNDAEAIGSLAAIAEYILTYDRDIVVPQDDSVLQLTETGNKIILRRSRGLAPNYFPNPFMATEDCILAMGGELKSAFALQSKQQLYISQYLGNQEYLASQKAFTHTAGHLLSLLQLQPSFILVDKHPGYFVSQLISDRTATNPVPRISIQHHKAHFGAVLAENQLLHTTKPVLGIIWDGTGYGDDKQIWGGEFFVYQDKNMQRVAQLDYFPQLLGDKMSREPRLSALGLLADNPRGQQLIKDHFSSTEWQYYRQLIREPAPLVTSSIGRLLDGIASLLNICQINTYEGEAAMKLEAVARGYTDAVNDHYSLPLRNNRLDHASLLQELTEDILQKKPTGYMAKKIMVSLAMAIGRVSDHFGIDQLAFSGGVFQNALLTDMINVFLSGKKKLYWHRQLSPNDECISFGQLACYQLMQKKKITEEHTGSVTVRELNYLTVN